MKKLLLFTLLLPGVSFGQSTLSKYELDKFQKVAVKYVRDFEEDVTHIAKGQQTYIGFALPLFDKDAQITVTKVGNKYSVQHYLSVVVPGYGKKYSAVAIAFEAIKVDDLAQKTDDQGNIYYEGSYQFKQYFKADRRPTVSKTGEGNMQVTTYAPYQDITTKTVKIIVKQANTIDGVKWIVKLGDISVDNVFVLK